MFDTEPLDTFLCAEPGHDVVAVCLADVVDGEADGFLSNVTASELFYLIARAESPDEGLTPGSFRVAEQDVRGLI